MCWMWCKSAKEKKIFLISYPFGTREMRRLNRALGQIQFTFYVYIVIPIKFDY